MCSSNSPTLISQTSRDFAMLVQQAQKLRTRKMQEARQRGMSEDTIASFPGFVALTDPRVPHFLEGVPLLPTGSAVILRHYHAPGRADIAQRLRILTRQHHILLLIAGDADLAQACDADGIHLPKWALPTLTPDTCRRWQQDNGWRITASVHTRAEHGRACQWGVDAALLSPIFPTKSHPGHPGLGVEVVTDIAQISPIPVLGLGGITAATVPHLQNSGLWGVAGISNFWILPETGAKKASDSIRCSKA